METPSDKHFIFIKILISQWLITVKKLKLFTGCGEINNFYQKLILKIGLFFNNH